MWGVAVTGMRKLAKRLPLNGIGEWLDGTWHWVPCIHYYGPSTNCSASFTVTLLRLFLNWMVFKVSAAPLNAPPSCLAAHRCVVQIDP